MCSTLTDPGHAVFDTASPVVTRERGLRQQASSGLIQLLGRGWRLSHDRSARRGFEVLNLLLESIKGARLRRAPGGLGAAQAPSSPGRLSLPDQRSTREHRQAGGCPGWQAPPRCRPGGVQSGRRTSGWRRSGVAGDRASSLLVGASQDDAARPSPTSCKSVEDLRPSFNACRSWLGDGRPRADPPRPDETSPDNGTAYRRGTVSRWSWT